MLKLIKYEFLKAKNLLIIALATLGVIEAMFLLGYVFQDGTLLGWGGGLFLLLPFLGLLALLIFSIRIFSSDIKNKQGYMLFLTPKSAYQIVGSKILLSLGVLLGGVLLYIVLAGINISIFTENSSIDKNAFSMFLDSLFAEENTEYVRFGVLAALVYVIEWFSMILTIYFSLTLTYTFMRNVKGKGILAFLIYLGITSVQGTISAMIMGSTFFQFLAGSEYASMEPLEVINQVGYLALGIGFVIYSLIGLLMYLATSRLIEKKLSI